MAIFSAVSVSLRRAYVELAQTTPELPDRGTEGGKRAPSRGEKAPMVVKGYKYIGHTRNGCVKRPIEINLLESDD